MIINFLEENIMAPPQLLHNGADSSIRSHIAAFQYEK